MSKLDARVHLYPTPTTKGRLLVGARIGYQSILDDTAALTLTVPLTVADALDGLNGFYAGVEIRDASGSWVTPRNNLFVFRERTLNEKDPARFADFTGALFVEDRAEGHLIDPSIVSEGEIKWPAASAGAVLADLLSRIPGHGITRTFTPAVDSAGVAWPAADIDDKAASVFTSVMDVLSTLTKAGYVSWWAQGTELVLRVPGGGVTRAVDMTAGADSVNVSSSMTDTASVFHVVTDTDVEPQVVTRPQLGLGPRHAVVTVAGATTAALALRMATPMIDAASKVRKQVTVTYQADALPALPFIDFQLGDNFTINGEAMRLVSVQVSTGDQVTVQLTFGEVFYTLAAKLAARTASITLGQGGTSVGTPLPAVTTPPASQPGAPTAPTLTSTLAQVIVAWDGLLGSGVPGTSVRGVVAEAAAASGGPWKQVTPDFTKGSFPFAASEVDVPVGETVWVRLRAINTKGVLSEPSPVASIVVDGIKAPDIDGAVTGAIQAAAEAAQTAQSTADGKTTISPDAPTPGDGVGKPVGSLWWRKSGDSVDGLWEWTGTAWSSKKYDEAVLGQVDIGVGTYGELSGVRLEAESISVTKLLVGNYTNLLDNPQFRQGLDGWTTSAGGNWWVDDVGGSWRYCARVNVTGTWTTLGGPRITCDEGDRFFISAGIYDPMVGTGEARIMVYFRDANGDDISSQWFTQHEGSAWSKVSGEVIAPAGTKTAQFLFNVAGRTSGVVVFGLPQMVRKVDANLIVDGSIYARHIKADEVWADYGFFTEARANVLSVGALTGVTITGPVVRTAETGQRVQLDPAGIRTFDSGNNETASLRADGGSLRLSGSIIATDLWAGAGFLDTARANVLSVESLTGVTITGSVVRTASSGQRIQLDTVGLRAYDSGNTLTASLTSSGGALVLSGRMQTSASGERAVLVDRRLVFYDSDGNVAGYVGQAVSDTQVVRLRSADASRAVSVSNSGIWVGNVYFSEPSSQTSRLTNEGGGLFDIGYDSTSGFIRSAHAYVRTYTGSANMYVTGEGTIGRATSLKAAKLDVTTQDIPDPYAILNVTPRTWIDRGSVERAVAEGYDDPEHRVRAFGAVVEEVEAYADYLLTNGPDGARDGLAYDRVGIALIPAIRALVERVAALEGSPAPVWATPPVYDDTAVWAEITGGAA